MKKKASRLIYHNMDHSSSSVSLLYGLFLFLLLVALTLQVRADTVELSIQSRPDGKHEYYEELLKKSLTVQGHSVAIKLLPALPQKQIARMLDDDMISLHWFVHTKKRDKRWIPIKIGLTNGLVGHRILFIPKNKQSLYNNINSLDDLRKTGMVNAFGKNWFDRKVWEANKLPYVVVDGEWRVIYRMLPEADRGIDYFSRGANEIIKEAEHQPHLDIEKRLVLVYDRDFRFYLSSPAAKYKNLIESSLRKAKESGLMDKLVREHFSDVFTSLNLDNRVKINLKSPTP